MTLPHLPIDDCLEALLAALDKNPCAVLIAPPGAGKSTRVPIAVLKSKWAKEGKIIMLEPRRIAARSVARYMASLLDEPVGQTVGYRVRLDSKTSDKTRIEVVTEGVFTRMALADPSLEGIACVIFDEFHERSLDADLGLALVLDIQSALREDLRVLAMSATLDDGAVSNLMGGAPVIESEGRSFDVEKRYVPRNANEPIETAVSKAVRSALATEGGSILCFLPGQREIERTAEALEGRLPDNAYLAPLYGMMDAKAQSIAIRPAEPGKRKIVLATNIAETSLTIDGIRIVIDSGLVRVSKYEQAIGVTRLVTERASLSSIDQRAGRAGRTAPGIAIRLWHEGQNGALAKNSQAEIKETDLTGLVLALADFGVSDPHKLRWIDPPPMPAWQEARKRLLELGAISVSGALTPLGVEMTRVPFPPSLAAMICQTQPGSERILALHLAFLLSERGLGGRSVDLGERLERFSSEKGLRAEQVRRRAASLARTIDQDKSKSEASETRSAGALLSLAFPDRIAMQRGQGEQYILTNGRGAQLEEGSRLSRHRFIVVGDLQGSAKQARITAAIPITFEEIEQNHGERFQRNREVRFDPKEKRVTARDVVSLGRLQFSEQAADALDADDILSALLGGIKSLGLEALPWSKSARATLGKLRFLRSVDPANWPMMDEDSLLEELETWLGPYLPGVSAFKEIAGDVIEAALIHRAGLSSLRDVDRLLPSHFKAPSGSNIPIRYDEQNAVLPIRVQELFGLKTHPGILDGKVPLTIELLSPAHRPIQTTSDLPGFWHGSWKEVRAEMRGRYPKHEWPEDPANATATARAKPRR